MIQFLGFPAASRVFTLLLLVPASIVVGCSSQHAATRSVPGSGDVPITYEVAGSGWATLVFVHGWCCDRTYWREQMPTFARSYRVVALDLGGHGSSPATRDDWSIESFARDVAAVANDVGAGRVVLVGHSMGGFVVLDAARRLGDRVAAVVCVDSIKRAPAEPLDRERAVAMFSRFSEDFAERMEALARRVFFGEATPAELIEWIAKDMAKAEPGVAMQAGVSHAMFDVGAALRGLEEVPVILINGDHGPTDADALRAARAGIRVVVVPNSGHFVMLERSEAFNGSLEAEIDRVLESE